MEIKKISEDIHANALVKGFWKSEDMIPRMKECGLFTEKEIIDLESALVSRKLLLIASEITEAMEADRKGRYMKTELKVAMDWANDKDFVQSFERNVKDTFEDEISDAVIRIFDLARRRNINLEAHIEAKCRYNKTRDYMHGKKY